MINSNYKIITDEKLLEEFVEWLPKLERGETYYVSLFARKKYSPLIKADKGQLKRFTCDKKNLINKIKQLEIAQGLYQIDGVAVPNEALALYIMPNPRSFIDATIKSTKELIDKITNTYDGYNPHQIVLSNIQKSPSKRRYLDFDFDGVDVDDLKLNLLNIINEDERVIVKTRGGVHVLVNIERIKNKKFYAEMMKLDGLDGSSNVDALLPVIGCTQGGFTPHFI